MLTIGVDLGQARDATAIACVRSYRPDVAEPSDGRRPRRVRHFRLDHLETLRPGTPYPEQATAIVALATDVAGDGDRPILFVDATGVGRPVVDLLRSACPHPVNAVTLTGQGEVLRKGASVSVPKSTLIGTLEVALSTRRLHAPAELPMRRQLDRELRAFGYDLSPTGRPLYGGKGAHDDLVLALALAVWGAEHGSGGTAGFVEFMRADTARRKDER